MRLVARLEPRQFGKAPILKCQVVMGQNRFNGKFSPIIRMFFFFLMVVATFSGCEFVKDLVLLCFMSFFAFFSFVEICFVL